MQITDARYDAALEAFNANIDTAGFAKAVGIRQELHLRTDMRGDLHGAFTLAVEEQLAA